MKRLLKNKIDLKKVGVDDLRRALVWAFEDLKGEPIYKSHRMHREKIHVNVEFRRVERLRGKNYKRKFRYVFIMNNQVNCTRENKGKTARIYNQNVIRKYFQRLYGYTIAKEYHITAMVDEHNDKDYKPRDYLSSNFSEADYVPAPGTIITLSLFGVAPLQVHSVVSDLSLEGEPTHIVYLRAPQSKESL